MGVAPAIANSGDILYSLYRHSPFCVSPGRLIFTVSVSPQSLHTRTYRNQTRPESPRWLVHEGHFEYARNSVAQANSNGDLQDPITVAVYKEIIDALDFEKKESRTMSPKEIFKTPTARKRLLIGMSAGPFSCVAGNIIASYYLGDELTTAGITDSTDQLKAVGDARECLPRRINFTYFSVSRTWY